MPSYFPKSPEERASESFAPEKLLEVREKTWAALKAIFAEVRVGAEEEIVKAKAYPIIKALGFEKNWHKVNLRFGENTAKRFSEPSRPHTILQENDLFYIDIGPIFEGYEGDVGKTFTVGKNERWERLAQDSERIFKETESVWRQQKASGRKLYEFAAARAEQAGWRLGNMDGHRLADFPHQTYFRGSLKKFENEPVPFGWVLEIFLIDDLSDRAAFYEDLLF